MTNDTNYLHLLAWVHTRLGDINNKVLVNLSIHNTILPDDMDESVVKAVNDLNEFARLYREQYQQPIFDMSRRLPGASTEPRKGPYDDL